MLLLYSGTVCGVCVCLCGVCVCVCVCGVYVCVCVCGVWCVCGVYVCVVYVVCMCVCGVCVCVVRMCVCVGVCVCMCVRVCVCPYEVLYRVWHPYGSTALFGSLAFLSSCFAISLKLRFIRQ